MNVYLDMVGCRLNQAEIETYARKLCSAGHNIVASADEADLVVVNTCAVTLAAASDSRQKIRQAARVGAAVVVTGCWSNLDLDGVMELPGVRRVIPNAQKDELVELILGTPPAGIAPARRLPVAGSRQRTRAFIKVQDGCDNHCTYCVTRLVRGPSRSCSIERILADIRSSRLGGAQETILTGVQIGSWGKDLKPRARLSSLVRTILSETDIPRLRISSIEPWEVDEDLISQWENRRLCRHFHLPLQSGSESILRRMARKTNPQEYKTLIDMIRQAIPGVSITTDIIVGFPGETDQEFARSLAFIDTIGFSGGHVFVYSPRPGTPAESFPGQVPLEVGRQRSKALREHLSAQAAIFQDKFVGKTLEVLWERSVKTPEGWQSSGLSDNYIRVTALTPEGVRNTISKVRIDNSENGVVAGYVEDHER